MDCIKDNLERLRDAFGELLASAMIKGQPTAYLETKYNEYDTIVVLMEYENTWRFKDV